MRIVFLGPPGVGKGTQTVRIADDLAVPAISIGDILRDHVTRSTELGVQVARYLAEGRLVPSEIVTAVVQQRLQHPDALSGFVLDGYPRTTEQAAALDAMLTHGEVALDVVFDLSAPAEELVRRLSYRGRQDDQPDVIRARLSVFQQEHTALQDYYRDLPGYTRIDGAAPLEQVSAALRHAIAGRTAVMLEQRTLARD